MKQALSMAGENRKELEKVFEHYKDDTLKLKAAQYLIVNMPFHFSRVDYFLSPDSQRYVLNITDFPDHQAVRSHCDSLQDRGYTIEKDIIYDIKKLNSDFLIRNIDLAFQVWQKPWAKDVSFDDFCRYILPYRTQTEPISDLRQKLMEQYLPLIDSGQANNSFEACMIINAELNKTLKYKETGSPLYPTIEETLQSGIGLCNALCNVGTQVMRALGIPVTVQIATWTKMDLSHNWCVVLHNGQFYDFSPAYGQPDVYKEILATQYNLKPAKIYRSLFDPEFKRMVVKDDGYITNLKSPLLRDVTAECGYATVDIRVKTDETVSTIKTQVYLCAHNYYEWVPLAIGVRNGSVCEFKEIAGNHIFMVAEAIDTYSLRYITAPFILNDNGDIRKFIPNTDKMVSQHLLRDPNKSPRELHYWDTQTNRFKLIGCDSINEQMQFYTQIPENALLWYRFAQKTLDERVGFIECDTLKRACDF